MWKGYLGNESSEGNRIAVFVVDLRVWDRARYDQIRPLGYGFDLG